MLATSAKIKQLRKAAGLTQEELGKKIGVTKATVNRYESQVISNITRPMIEKLAEALDCSPAYLMGWEDKSVTVSGTNNNVVNNSENVNINTILSQEEQELIRIYRSLTVKGRMEMLNNAFALEENNK